MTAARHNAGAPPLPLAGEGWGGGISASEDPRGERAPTRRALRARRPPPQAGEVQRARGETASITQHDFLATAAIVTA
ncbi:hypothetical protein CVM73_34915 [Bradyrhizobium forestalis]|uniref:Uncharacterized protein n=1 Tax=Bradyrhizobium forestalis TaxID=1419263 RepID=A0A2M8QYL7_9BRAD|nr:hypothetical protein CVM73_34915 [Bradyrhizobium forestalis]